MASTSEEEYSNEGSANEDSDDSLSDCVDSIEEPDWLGPPEAEEEEEEEEEEEDVGEEEDEEEGEGEEDANVEEENQTKEMDTVVEVKETDMSKSLKPANLPMMAQLRQLTQRFACPGLQVGKETGS